MNAIDALLVAIVLVMALFNCYMFIWKGKIRQLFIILFYVLTFFCLVSWEISSIAYVIKPTARLGVYQMIDNPTYYQVIFDIS